MLRGMLIFKRIVGEKRIIDLHSLFGRRGWFDQDYAIDKKSVIVET
jgi:hypothetical protein